MTTSPSRIIPGTPILTNIQDSNLSFLRGILSRETGTNQVIYHKDCLDGTVSAFVAWMNIPVQETDFHPMTYQDSVPEKFLKSDQMYTIILVDFSLPVDILHQMTSCGHHVIVIDHHESAIMKILRHPCSDIRFWYFLADEHAATNNDQKHSGGSLARKFFDYLRAGERSVSIDSEDDEKAYHRLIELARTHDLWLHKGDPKSDALALSYWHRKKTVSDLIGLWSSERVFDITVHAMVNEGRFHLSPVVDEIDGIVKCGCLVQIGGKSAWLFYCERGYASLACAIVNQRSPIALAFHKEGEKFKVSIRTSDYCSVPASELAEPFGGGGHEHAASFYTDKYPAVLLKAPPPTRVAYTGNVVINSLG